MRYTSNGKCVECNSLYMKTYYQDNKDSMINAVRDWQIDNDSKVRSYSKAYYHRHKDSILLNKSFQYENDVNGLRSYFEQYYKNNKDDQKARVRSWQMRNRGKVNAASAKRRVQIEARSFDQWNDVIEAIYDNCPEGYHVDHIDPLNGKDRSGLHVPWNLQYLPAEDNHKKSNKVDYSADRAIEIDWKQYI